VLHKRLNRHDVCSGPGGQIVFVGDVHGCASELRALLGATSFEPGRDTLVLVGDLVNKGPRSDEVLRLSRELGALAVRGNHDDELLEAWYRVGRFARGLKPYKNNALFQVTAADVLWLQELPLSLSFPWLGLVVVHAGMVPGVALEEQRFEDLLFIRDVVRARVGPDVALELKEARRSPSNGGAAQWVGLQSPEDGSTPWAEAWNGPERVVFGHDARRKLQCCAHATGLDTGCCYGNSLTALIVDADDVSQCRFASVPAECVHKVPRNAHTAVNMTSVA